jgi:integrase
MLPQKFIVKKNLTHRTLKALKPATPGQRYEILDAVQPGLAIRVTSSGAKTFVLRSRFPGSPHFTRKALGAYPTLTLAQARDKARNWLRLVAEGIDPEIEAERARQSELRKQRHTFAFVAERFIDEAVIGPDPNMPLQRQGRQTANYIRNTLVPRWGRRPIANIDDIEIAAFLRERRETPAHARNLFVKLRCLFSWAIQARSYGLKVSPCDHIKINKLIGNVKTRDRTLTDEELAAFWKSIADLGYPSGPLYRLLLLTGVRLNEAARASWPEFDLLKREWTIPASRMKGKHGKARAHLVPLTDAILEVLNGLPRFKDGEFLFSTTFGKKPISLGNKIKKRLDAAMLAEMCRAENNRGGENSNKIKLAPWVNHDLRRSVRTRLSALKISREVKEAVLAHTPPGIIGTYDLHQYQEEKLEALTAWGATLAEIVGAAPQRAENVVKLQQRAHRDGR